VNPASAALLREGDSMRKSIIVLACVAACCLTAQESFAAIKFKRFEHCPQGLVTAKTCECHVGTTGRFHYCHAGHYCHYDGSCRE
jgi:hypothetical protein